MDKSYNRYKQNVGVTYTSPIFGPIRSRRLGISLGINLLPADGKWCSFDCIYCECGLNRDKKARQPLPTRMEVSKALEETLLKMKADGELPDVLTFAGNGEPTLHPEFSLIMDDVISLRDTLCPQAKVSVLSNSTQLHQEQVRNALLRADNPIMKLDTVDDDYIRNVDRPAGHYSAEDIIQAMTMMNGHIIIQTMFMHMDGVSNTGDEYVQPYIEALRRIHPMQIMIYTIDRDTPVEGLSKATPQEMDSVADRIRSAGFDVSVSY